MEVLKGKVMVDLIAQLIKSNNKKKNESKGGPLVMYECQKCYILLDQKDLIEKHCQDEHKRLSKSDLEHCIKTCEDLDTSIDSELDFDRLDMEMDMANGSLETGNESQDNESDEPPWQKVIFPDLQIILEDCVINPPPTPTTLKVSDDREKFICSICYKVLSSEISLRVHKKAHISDKRVARKVSNVAFAMEPLLKIPKLEDCDPSKLSNEISKTNDSQVKPSRIIQNTNLNSSSRLLRSNPLANRMQFTGPAPRRPRPRTVARMQALSCPPITVKRYQTFTLALKTVKCTYNNCRRSFSDLLQMQEHRKCHNKIKECPNCSRKFNHSSNLNRHLQTKACITKTTPFSDVDLLTRIPCTLCDVTLKTQKGLDSHRRKIHGINKPRTVRLEIGFPCLFCGYKAPSAYSLSRHQRSHTGEKPFICSACGGGFSDKGNMLKHTVFHCKVARERNITVELSRSKSAIEKPARVQEPSFEIEVDVKPALNSNSNANGLKCKFCEEIFQAHSKLKTHELVHGDKYPCVHCPASYAHYMGLSIHMRRFHSENIVSPPCTICGMKFLGKYSLKIHYQQVHRCDPPWFTAGMTNKPRQQSQISAKIRKKNQRKSSAEEYKAQMEMDPLAIPNVDYFPGIPIAFNYDEEETPTSDINNFVYLPETSQAGLLTAVEEVSEFPFNAEEPTDLKFLP